MCYFKVFDKDESGDRQEQDERNRTRDWVDQWILNWWITCWWISIGNVIANSTTSNRHSIRQRWCIFQAAHSVTFAVTEMSAAIHVETVTDSTGVEILMFHRWVFNIVSSCKITIVYWYKMLRFLPSFSWFQRSIFQSRLGMTPHLWFCPVSSISSG